MFRLGGGGGKNKREAQVVAEHAREEVLFWKRELDEAVEEKNAWKQRFYLAYRELGVKEEALNRAQQQHADLRFVLDKTLEQELRASTAHAAGSSTADGGGSTAAGLAGAAAAAAGKMSTAAHEAKFFAEALADARAKLQQADRRVGILEERLASLQQDNRTLMKQNDLLRASEGAFQRETKLLREELRNQCGINDLTADETTKLLLDNSRLAQANAALQSDVMHKDEVIRLLQSQLSDLNTKLDGSGATILVSSLNKSISGLPVGWELGCLPDAAGAAGAKPADTAGSGQQGAAVSLAAAGDALKSRPGHPPAQPRASADDSDSADQHDQLRVRTPPPGRSASPAAALLAAACASQPRRVNMHLPPAPPNGFKAGKLAVGASRAARSSMDGAGRAADQAGGRAVVLAAQLSPAKALLQQARQGQQQRQQQQRQQQQLAQQQEQQPEQQRAVQQWTLCDSREVSDKGGSADERLHGRADEEVEQQLPRGQVGRAQRVVVLHGGSAVVRGSRASSEQLLALSSVDEGQVLQGSPTVRNSSTTSSSRRSTWQRSSRSSTNTGGDLRSSLSSGSTAQTEDLFIRPQQLPFDVEELQLDCAEGPSAKQGCASTARAVSGGAAAVVSVFAAESAAGYDAAAAGDAAASSGVDVAAADELAAVESGLLEHDADGTDTIAAGTSATIQDQPAAAAAAAAMMESSTSVSAEHAPSATSGGARAAEAGTPLVQHSAATAAMPFAEPAPQLPSSYHPHNSSLQGPLGLGTALSTPNRSVRSSASSQVEVCEAIACLGVTIAAGALAASCEVSELLQGPVAAVLGQEGARQQLDVAESAGGTAAGATGNLAITPATHALAKQQQQQQQQQQVEEEAQSKQDQAPAQPGQYSGPAQLPAPFVEGVQQPELARMHSPVRPTKSAAQQEQVQLQQQQKERQQVEEQPTPSVLEPAPATPQATAVPTPAPTSTTFITPSTDDRYWDAAAAQAAGRDVPGAVLRSGKAEGEVSRSMEKQTIPQRRQALARLVAMEQQQQGQGQQGAQNGGKAHATKASSAPGTQNAASACAAAHTAHAAAKSAAEHGPSPQPSPSQRQQALARLAGARGAGRVLFAGTGSAPAGSTTPRGAAGGLAATDAAQAAPQATTAASVLVKPFNNGATAGIMPGNILNKAAAMATNPHSAAAQQAACTAPEVTSATLTPPAVPNAASGAHTSMPAPAAMTSLHNSTHAASAIKGVAAFQPAMQSHGSTATGPATAVARGSAGAVPVSNPNADSSAASAACSAVSKEPALLRAASGNRVAAMRAAFEKAK